MSYKRYPEEELLEFWRTVVDPKGIGMPEAIAAEISSFTGDPVSVTLAKMLTGKEDFKKEWEAARVDPNDRKQVEDFYAGQIVEIYGLANWHSGRTYGIPPLNYAWAASFAREKGLKRILDFGSGIGTGTLVMTQGDCEVHAADIGTRMLEFVQHRVKLRGLTPRLINLDKGEKPPANYFDMITCFDVLEHVPDQAEKLRELETYLVPGGYVLVNFMYDSAGVNQPMHISSAGHWDLLVRKSGFIPVWAYCEEQLQVLRKSHYAPLRHGLASAADWVRARIKSS